MAMKKRRETAEERRLRKMLAMAVTATQKERKRLQALLAGEREARERDAKDAAALLLEEKKRREETEAGGRAREALQEAKTGKALEEWGKAMGERDAYSAEIFRLERVVLEMAKAIYTAAS